MSGLLTVIGKSSLTLVRRGHCRCVLRTGGVRRGKNVNSAMKSRAVWSDYYAVGYAMLHCPQTSNFVSNFEAVRNSGGILCERWVEIHWENSCLLKKFCLILGASLAMFAMCKKLLINNKANIASLQSTDPPSKKRYLFERDRRSCLCPEGHWSGVSSKIQTWEGTDSILNAWHFPYTFSHYLS